MSRLNCTSKSVTHTSKPVCFVGAAFTQKAGPLWRLCASFLRIPECCIIPAIVVVLMWVCCLSDAAGVDKSGVKPQVLSLPSGPGSIEGLGESFAATEPEPLRGAIKLEDGAGACRFAPECALLQWRLRQRSLWPWLVAETVLHQGGPTGLSHYDANDVFVSGSGGTGSCGRGHLPRGERVVLHGLNVMEMADRTPSFRRRHTHGYDRRRGLRTRTAFSNGCPRTNRSQRQYHPLRICGLKTLPCLTRMFSENGTHRENR